MRILVAAAAMVLVAATARAETFPVITDQTVLTECGDCHMAFPPETLSKAAWQKIMANLGNHFGEDATLDDATAAKVLAYHVANANDVTNVRASQKWRATPPAARIIDAPRFVKKHKQCPDAVWSHPQVKSKSNCLACHKDMQKTGSTKEDVSFLPPALARACGED